MLIVEDDEPGYRFYEAKLKKKGVRILHAANGNEAINVFKLNNIDIVIINTMIPVKEGFTAKKEIKEIALDVPVIMLTAYANHDSIRKVVKSGFTDYLSKPIETEVMFSVLKKWLIG
ncbi:MAG: response regulator [Bacteroidales bacterium]|nr:response regulator [Bacteroidales bacterium]MCF8333070.1 response regulator [Bacteroidales bacterium]